MSDLNGALNDERRLEEDAAAIDGVAIIICSICHELYRPVDNVHVCNCGHVYHYDCLQQWLKESSNCPACRSVRPNTFRLYLDFEHSFADLKRKQLAKKVKKTDALVKLTELDMREYENLLYEGHLYREEIEHLNNCALKRETELAKKNAELAAEKLQNTKLKMGLQALQRSAMEHEVYENFLSDFINTMNGLQLDDEKDKTKTQSNDEEDNLECEGACGIIC